jgi:hypothetical protein
MEAYAEIACWCLYLSLAIKDAPYRSAAYAPNKATAPPTSPTKVPRKNGRPFT